MPLATRLHAWALTHRQPSDPVATARPRSPCQPDLTPAFWDSAQYVIIANADAAPHRWGLAVAGLLVAAVALIATVTARDTLDDTAAELGILTGTLPLEAYTGGVLAAWLQDDTASAVRREFYVLAPR